MARNPKPPKDDDGHRSGRADKRSRPKKTSQQSPPAANGPEAGPETKPQSSRRKKAPATSRAGKQALREANELLEARVRERTAQLEQANCALQEEIAERKRAEEAVKAERQRFNDVLETLPAYLVLLTPDYHVPFANRFFRERFGESHGKRCFEYLFGRTEPCEVCETYKVLKTMKPLEWEWTGLDGRNYYIYDFPFKDTDGSTLIMETGIDVTELKCAENALKEANETLEQRVAERTAALQEATQRLQAQTEELDAQAEELRESESQLAYLASFPQRNPSPVLEVDLDGHVRYLSPAAERLFPDLRRRGPEHPWLADWAALVRAFREERADTSVRDLTIGERTYQQAFYYSAEDRFVRIYAFDITERKQAAEALREANEQLGAQAEELQAQAEELQAQAEGLTTANDELREQEQALRESEERFRTIFDGSTDGILIVDPQSKRFLMGNSAICRMLGYTPEEIATMQVADIHHDEDLSLVMEHFEKLASAADGIGPSIPVKRRDGSVFFADITANSIILSGRTYLVGSFRDITERKRAEERLHKENRVIALSNRILRVFVEETGDDLFDKALQIVLEGTESRHGVFGYIDENGDLVCPSMSKLLAECEVANKCIRYPRGKWKGLWSRALLEKQTLCTNEPPAVPGGHVPIRNNLAAPILFQDRVLGLLNLANKASGYSEADRELIEALAGRVAPVLYAWVQRQLRESERAAAERALAESEQRLRLALEGGSMGRWEWDLQTDSMFCCERARKLLGFGPSSPATTESLLRHVHPDDHVALAELRTRTPAEPADFQVDFRVMYHWENGRGEVRWLASRGRVIHDEQGRAVRVIAVLYDITPHKQMEEQLRRMNDQLEKEVVAQTEELRESIDRLQDEVARRVLAEGKLRRRSQMLEAFFQHTITPLAFMDRHFNFVRVNAAYARADDKTPEFFPGKNHFALYPHEENQAIFQRVVQTKKPYHAYAKPFGYANSPERGVSYWNWQLTPLLNEFGDVQSLVLNLEDVTERQKTFHELEQRARQLQKLTLELSQAEDRERRRLAEILHDDLQQQLAAAKFHLGILSTQVKDDAPVHEMTGQLNVMLKDAIEKSRSLSHELSPAALYQSDLGETFEWLARQVHAKHGLVVHVEVRGRVDPKSEAIRAFLFKAGREILFNVVKHARTREAKLRLQNMRNQLWLTIADKGQGFDPESLHSTGGFGLLSIRERVGLLGGRMKIRSVRGKGSAFLIAVPDADTTEATTLTSPRPTQDAAGTGERKLRVLLVDDHKVVREGLAALLTEQRDIEVVGQAGNGREAVDQAHRLHPDVIIMDAAMPVMPGDEATRQIKLYLPATRIIGLSMSAEPELAERMREAGAEAYLLKTAPSEELLAVIRGMARG